MTDIFHLQIGATRVSKCFHFEDFVNLRLAFNIIYIYIFFLILFIDERPRERGRDLGRGRSKILRGSLIRESIPGPEIMP